MSIQDFINNFAFQFDDTDASELTKDTVFKNLDEWSSLTALSIIAMCDEEYDVALKGDDISNSKTIEDLFNLVKSKA
jgi:acyl carrier protein